MLMDDIHYLISRMRSGDGKHGRVCCLDNVALGAETACNDDLAVFIQRFTDGVERLLNCGIDKAAGIDDNEVRIIVTRRDFVALGAQLGQDTLGIR